MADLVYVVTRSAYDDTETLGVFRNWLDLRAMFDGKDGREWMTAPPQVWVWDMQVCHDKPVREFPLAISATVSVPREEPSPQ